MGVHTYPRINPRAIRRLGIAPESAEKFRDLRSVFDQDEI